MGYNTHDDLEEMQGYSLEQKIKTTQTKILEWNLRHESDICVVVGFNDESKVLTDLSLRVCKAIPIVTQCEFNSGFPIYPCTAETDEDAIDDWMEEGCNNFKKEFSIPMMFWKKEDIKIYLDKYMMK